MILETVMPSVTMTHALSSDKPRKEMRGSESGLNVPDVEIICLQGFREGCFSRQDWWSVTSFVVVAYWPIAANVVFPKVETCQ